VALAWTPVHPAVTAPIAGSRTLPQLEGALRVVKLRQDESTLKRLDGTFPGQVGDAPSPLASGNKPDK
jgi:aryl-alcohol dehydrogenase-like predicted oxidoreductase